MAIKLIKKKKNLLTKELFTKKYKPRIIKPKKGKGSFKRIKKLKIFKLFFYIYVKANYNPVFIRKVLAYLMR